MLGQTNIGARLMAYPNNKIAFFQKEAEGVGAGWNFK